MKAWLHLFVLVAGVSYMEVRKVGLIPPKSIQKLKLGFFMCPNPMCVMVHIYLFFSKGREMLWFFSKVPLQTKEHKPPYDVQKFVSF